MDSVLAGLAYALWLGILTSISPCPLASNVAAISFLSRKIGHPKAIFLSGFAYTAGRMVAYAVLGFIIINSLLSIPALANFLQRYVNKALGPILILSGLFLLGILKFNVRTVSLSEKHQDKLAGSGIAGAFVLGLIFALAFCPISAALFFGSLIPLALSNRLGATLPLVYGVGTGLPVLIFAFAIALGAKSLNRWFQRLTRLEYHVRKATGIIFILVGLYYVRTYLVRVF
ncbi:MAG: aromatic aminobenezylarsenical efflux permease ArsG family transporter [Candidatus Eisenbacteria bacterium]|nr:aromatic aminobenezylarsenical efflux permease ArsG family transporter [Candidatus Eisenbacteria bacterium]